MLLVSLECVTKSGTCMRDFLPFKMENMRQNIDMSALKTDFRFNYRGLPEWREYTRADSFVFFFFNVPNFLIVDCLQNVLRSGRKRDGHEVACLEGLISSLTEDGGPHLDNICDNFSRLYTAFTVLDALKEGKKLDAFSAQTELFAEIGKQRFSRVLSIDANRFVGFRRQMHAIDDRFRHLSSAG